MLKTLQLLKTNRSIKTYAVLDFKQGKTFYYIKVKAVLVNKSTLYIREYISDNTRNNLRRYLEKDKRSSLISY